MIETGEMEALVRRHEHSLYRTALAILANPQEAEDAVQDTFVKYLEKRPVCPDVPAPVGITPSTSCPSSICEMIPP